MHPTLGSPKSSPLSLLLWNIIVHNLLCLLMPKGVTMQAYTQDNPHHHCCRVEKATRKTRLRGTPRVLDCTQVAKVQINKEKTFCIIFTHGQGRLGMKSRLTIRAERADRALTFKDSIRMLGVMFDQRFFFFLHTDALKTKVESL